MSSVITNIYNKKNQTTYLNGIVHSRRKTEKVFFWQIEMFEVCTMGDTAHIDAILKVLATQASTSLVVRKKLFQFSCGCEQFH
jgi:hypothetical protein